MPDEPRDWAERGLPPELDPRGPRRDGTRPPVGQRSAAGSVLGPAPSRGHRVARALSWVAVITSVAVLGVSGAGYAYLRSVGGDITQIEAFRPGADRPEAAERGALNVLLVGSDSRGDLEAGEGVQGTGDEFVEGQRADTVILAHLFADSDQVQLVSFPRDSYVEIPAHPNPANGEPVPDTMGKLNRSFQVGGAPLLTETVERLTGLRIDHYVQIDFDGFRAMVDAVDGVEVCLPKPAKEKLSGIDLPAGRQTIGGDQALAFVRQRYGLPRGDLDRIARQQQFLGSLARKVLSSETLLNPLRVDDFVRSVAASLKTDTGTGVSDLTQIALRMRGFSAGGVSFTAVPVTDIDARRKNADGLFESVVLLDETASEDLFRDLRLDRAPGEVEPEPDGAATPAPVLIVAPGNVRVEVFNGAGVQGLGARAAADLTEVGFTVAGAPGNRGTGETRTVVLHGPEKADSAATLAAAVPGATTELDPSLAGSRTVQLVLGSDYSGAREVTVTGRAPSAPAEAPAASARPTPQTAAQDPCAV